MPGLTRRVAIAAAAGLAAGFGASVSAAPVRAGWVAAPGDMNLGNPRARVRVVEYMSLTCAHCAHFKSEVFPAFKTRYIDTGRVFYTARELLTVPAQVAAAGVMMARCNGGTRYFPIIDQVLRSQSRISSTSNLRCPPAVRWHGTRPESAHSRMVGMLTPIIAAASPVVSDRLPGSSIRSRTPSHRRADGPNAPSAISRPRSRGWMRRGVGCRPPSER